MLHSCTHRDTQSSFPEEIGYAADGMAHTDKLTIDVAHNPHGALSDLPKSRSLKPAAATRSLGDDPEEIQVRSKPRNIPFVSKCSSGGGFHRLQVHSVLCGLRENRYGT